MFDYAHSAEPLEPAVPDELYDREDVPCADCSEPFKLGSFACEGCGLTLVEIAERLAR